MGVGTQTAALGFNGQQLPPSSNTNTIRLRSNLPPQIIRDSSRTVCDITALCCFELEKRTLLKGCFVLCRKLSVTQKTSNAENDIKVLKTTDSVCNTTAFQKTRVISSCCRVKHFITPMRYQNCSLLQKVSKCETRSLPRDHYYSP